VVHMTSGYAGLAGSIVLGRGEAHGEEKVTPHVPYVLLGTSLLLFGWCGRRDDREWALFLVCAGGVGSTQRDHETMTLSADGGSHGGLWP
jgi:hypothetical protein